MRWNRTLSVIAARRNKGVAGDDPVTASVVIDEARDEAREAVAAFLEGRQGQEKGGQPAGRNDEGRPDREAAFSEVGGERKELRDGMLTSSSSLAPAPALDVSTLRAPASGAAPDAATAVAIGLPWGQVSVGTAPAENSASAENSAPAGNWGPRKGGEGAWMWFPPPRAWGSLPAPSPPPPHPGYGYDYG